MDVKATMGLRGFYLLMSSILKQKVFFYVYNYFAQLRKIVSGSGQKKGSAVNLTSGEDVADTGVLSISAWDKNNGVLQIIKQCEHISQQELTKHPFCL